MIYDIETHKMHEYLRDSIKAFSIVFGIPPVVVRDMAKFSVWSSNLSENTRQFMLGNQVAGSNHLYRGMFEAIDEWSDGIVKIRRERKDVDKYQPVKTSIKDGQKFASNILGTLFPRSNYQINSHDKKDYSERSENGWVFCTDVDAYYPINHLRLPVTWYSKVYKKGLAVIKSTKGQRFVVSAEEFKASWLDDEDMTAYRVVSTAPHKKLASVEDGWVVVFNQQKPSKKSPLFSSDDNYIDALLPHSYNTTLPKAVSLLRRRVTSHVLDTVLGV